MSRPFHVVVWGATGFTGRLVAEHLARDYSGGAGTSTHVGGNGGISGSIKWAIAGRNLAKLESLRAELAKQYGADLEALPVLVADVEHPASLDRLAEQTRVLLSTAGPFALHGMPVVDAAVRSGCHYVDITGEVLFVKRSVAKHHDEAARRGLRIVHCCGYDSIPSDLGTLLLVDHMRQRLGKQPAKVLSAVMSIKSEASGSTIASGLNQFVEQSREPGIDPSDVYTLVPPEARGGDGEFWGTEYCPELGRYLAPFVMQACNNRVVHRSNYLLGYTAPSSEFRYQEAMALRSWAQAKAVELATRATSLAISFTWLHPLLKRFLPAPGTGPSREKMMWGHYRHAVVGWTKEEGGTPPTVVRAEVSDKRDAGYWGTSRMVLEAALCLALEQEVLDGRPELVKGGVLTPASAMGTVLIDRLRKSDIVYQIQDGGAAA